jgi:hypothetical protein
MRATGVVKKLVVGVVTFGGALAVLSAPVRAQAANGLQDGSGIQAGASDPGDGPSAQPVSNSPQGRGGGATPTCTAVDGSVGPAGYRRVPSKLLTQEERDRLAREGGSFVTRFCGNELAPKLPGPGLDLEYRAPGGPRAPAADPAQLATEALERVPLPEPDITMAPASDIPQLVNLATFLWLHSEQWQPVTASATAGGVTSTVTATPVRVVWDMGQGASVVCDGPGLPYRPDLPDDRQPSDCHYTYRYSSAGQPGQAFTVTATVEWETTWSVTGAPGGGSLGTVSRSASIPVQVAELQSLNVYPRA